MVGAGEQADPLSRPPRAAPESGRSAATTRGRADPPGGPVREPRPEAGGEARPGKSRWRALIHWLDQRIGTERDGQTRAVLHAVVAGPPLERFLEMVAAYRLRQFPPTVRWVKYVEIEDQRTKDRIGERPIGVISREGRAALAAAPGVECPTTRLVRLSAETAVKQAINHPDLTADHYRLLPSLIEGGYMVVEGGRNLIFYRRFGRRWYKAVVKQTTRSELYLTTFRKANHNQVPSGARGREGWPGAVAHGGARDPSDARQPHITL